jgi:predicted RNA-binding protein YlqC (UPF0109 family)
MKSSPTEVQTDNECCSMKELVEVMARSLVDQPEAISVTEIGGTHSSILELKVAKEDIGKIIGKQGRTADAMRTILSAVAEIGRASCRERVS